MRDAWRLFSLDEKIGTEVTPAGDYWVTDENGRLVFDGGRWKDCEDRVRSATDPPGVCIRNPRAQQPVPWSHSRALLHRWREHKGR